MKLLTTYLIIVFLGQAGVITLSLVLDRLTSPFMSTFVFFVLFFVTIWLAWKIAVWLTEPKHAT